MILFYYTNIMERGFFIMSFYLAIDIGASSGRHILGSVVDGKLNLEEVYRFDNNIIKEDGNIYWDVEHLFSEVLAGIKECGKLGKIPSTIAIDTWGVDVGFLDKAGQLMQNPYNYRDVRTQGILEKAFEIVSEFLDLSGFAGSVQAFKDYKHFVCFLVFNLQI